MRELIERMAEVLPPKPIGKNPLSFVVTPVHAAEMHNRFARLAAALEAAREDAERYRWLRDSPERPCRVPCAYAVMPGDVEYPTPLGGETLDAAIDQARGKGGGEAEGG